MKITKGLIKLLKKNSSPEIVVKYIYKNVFELMKETILKNPNKFINQTKNIRDLSKYYFVYYEKIINNSDLEWPKTILPPYIHGHKNFYTGVAGRLALFSNDLEKEAANYNDRERKYALSMRIAYASSPSSSDQKLKEALKEAAEYLNCNEDEVSEKLDERVDEIPTDGTMGRYTPVWEIHADGTKVKYMPVTGTLEEHIPNTYYWYGNPKNWSDCYEISLDKNNELVIRKSQIVILESKPKDGEMTEDEYTNSRPEQGEILLVPKKNLDNYLYTDNYLNFLYIDNNDREYYLDRFSNTPLFPVSEASCNHTEDNERIEKMMLDYITNVSEKNGYNPEIQKMWTEYNKINAYYKKKILGRKNWKNLREYKILEEEKSVELEEKFMAEYKEKLEKIKEKVEKQIEEIPEEKREFLAIELNWLKTKLNQVLKK